ncbi:hypothetical protein IDH10_04025 [Pelagibacterales bacterium SAG-MED20]|nr:hypothetical protein [Pelagibacterales bacterium SAG-MED20]
MHLKKNILIFLTFVFFSFIIYLLITKQIIYPTIIPMVRNDAANLFADWTVILQANLCIDKGYDVFLDNPCDYWNRKHVYGEILLYLPFIKAVPKFYFLVFPIMINLLFVYTIVRLFTYQVNIKYFSLFILILNTPVLLAIERANIDIIIFVIMVFIAKNKNIIFKHMAIVFAVMLKFYPLSLSILFFFEKNTKKIITNLLIILLLILAMIFFQWGNLLKIFSNEMQFTGYGYGVYEFSFIGGFKFIKELTIYIGNKDYYLVKYIYLFLVVFVPVGLINLYYFKKLNQHTSINKMLIENNFENKLYILSSALILSCYFLLSNFIYREIFFLGLIPFILREEKNENDNNFFSFYFYLLTFKFLFSSILTYISRNNLLPNFEPLIVALKHSLDFYLISIVLLTFLFFMKNFLRSLPYKYRAI